MEKKQFYKNKLGLAGWISGGRFGLERYAYTLHRVTGLGILLYFILHIFVTYSRVNGEQAWAAAMGQFESTLFHIGEFLVYVAFAYHALNGIRLILNELGFGLGKPIRPIYPYKVSVHRQRPLLIGVMLLAAIFILAGGYDFFMAN